MDSLFAVLYLAVIFPRNIFSDGSIFINPLSSVVAPYKIAIFNCSTSADIVPQPVSLEIYINNTLFSGSSSSFKFANYIQVQGLAITFNATPEINNTQLYCNDPYVNQWSSTAVLYIASPPNAPSPRVNLVNSTAMEVSWDPPFTPAGFNILFYTVTIVNTSSGITRTTSPLINASYLYSTNGSQVSRSCDKIDFYVAASSAVGQSKSGCVNATFPVAVPRNFTLEPVVVIRNMSTGVQAEVTVQFPVGLCPSQPVNYSIAVRDADSGVNVFEQNISLGTFVDLGPIKNTFATPELANRYVLTANLESVTGSVITTVVFSTVNFISQYPTKDTIGTAPTLPNNETNCCSLSPYMYVATVSLSGMTAVLLVAVTLLSFAVACFRISNKRLKISSARYQAHNPIYSGTASVYETVSEASFQTQVSNRLSIATSTDEKEKETLCYELRPCESEQTLEVPNAWGVPCKTEETPSQNMQQKK